jgi:hypothetical protein
VWSDVVGDAVLLLLGTEVMERKKPIVRRREREGVQLSVVLWSFWRG